MNLRHLPAVLVLLAAGLDPLRAADSPRPARPNILVIVADDLGYADVGFHGGREIPTPNLDALAAAGVRFTSGYVTGPYCSPTRAAFLAGRHQARFGHEFNPSGSHGLPAGVATLADRLKTAGYATALVGKWHLGSGQAHRPTRRGFDEFYGFLEGSHSYVKGTGMLRGDKPAPDLDYATDAFGREAVSFIERHRRQPWFLYLAFNAVHTPMEATPARLEKFAGIAQEKRRTYAAMLLAMDEAVGQVRRKLTEAGLEQDTLVVFFSDNGGPTMPGTTVNAARNDPLRGSKRTTLEGGIRVPFVIAWPGQLKPGVFHAPVTQVDTHATALAVAGMEPKPEWKLEGVNLLPFLRGERTGAPHEALFWRFGEQMAVRAGDYKLVRYDRNADAPVGGGQAPVTAARLYNLANDLGETNDLAAVMPEKVRELQARWNAWNAGNPEPLWGSGGGEGQGSGQRNRNRAAEKPRTPDSKPTP